MIALLMKLIFAMHKETFFPYLIPMHTLKSSQTHPKHTQSHYAKKLWSLHGLCSHNSFKTRQELANSANKFHRKIIIWIFSYSWGSKVLSNKYYRWIRIHFFQYHENQTSQLWVLAWSRTRPCGKQKFRWVPPLERLLLRNFIFTFLCTT